MTFSAAANPVERPHGTGQPAARGERFVPERVGVVVGRCIRTEHRRVDPGREVTETIRHGRDRELPPGGCGRDRAAEVAEAVDDLVPTRRHEQRRGRGPVPVRAAPALQPEDEQDGHTEDHDGDRRNGRVEEQVARGTMTRLRLRRLVRFLRPRLRRADRAAVRRQRRARRLGGRLRAGDALRDLRFGGRATVGGGSDVVRDPSPARDRDLDPRLHVAEAVLPPARVERQAEHHARGNLTRARNKIAAAAAYCSELPTGAFSLRNSLMRARKCPGGVFSVGPSS